MGARRNASPVASLIAALAGVAGAPGARAEDASTGRAPLVPLVTEAAAWRWELVHAPRLAPQIGALAASGLDVVAGRAAAPIAVLGDVVDAPAGWPYAVAGTAAAIGAPPADRRIAAAFGTTTFALGAGEQDLEMLELRLRYEDGVAVWINGVEVARHDLPRAGGAAALARAPRGPEWETFHLPIAPGLLLRGDNVLAIEVHPSGRRHGPALAATLGGRRDRGIVRGPILVDATATTATIAVETDPGIDATIEWSAGAGPTQRRASPPGRRHVFALDGLPANGPVAYRVTAGATRSRRYAFHTMPAPGAVVRVGVYGDVRGGHAVHRRLVEHMLREGLDVVAVTGDMVLRGSDEGDWQRFFAVTADLLAQVPYLPAIGNHDLGWGAARAGRAGHAFALPPGPPGRPDGAFWYSHDVADVHLVFLDSNAYDRPEQEAWLDADLAAARARGVRAIFAITHDGPYARGYHGGSAIARARYVPILARHRVDLVLSGHDHLYQRGEIGGLRYVVSGGGGAPLYGIRCGVPGRPRCAVDDGMLAVAREHHYVVVTVARDLELCTRRVDGTLLERCVRLPLR